LTGRLFSIAMIGGKDLGYTRLKGRTIHVNPLPMLRGERGGERVVKGLILHEFGHHMYHAEPESLKIWDTATEQRLHSLLNLVSDEHLERNLRARRGDDGDALKQLCAHAFQHADREINGLTLMAQLGARAYPILRDLDLTPGRATGSVQVNVGRVWQSLEAQGSSFGRFVRALRMGLGNRHNDPKVAQGLQLFKGRFRHSTMARLYDITQELHAIFGADIQILNALGFDAAMGASAEEITVLTDGITDQELEGAVQRCLLYTSPSPRDRTRSRMPASA